MTSLRDKCKRSLGGTAVRPADRRDNVPREGDDLWPRRECPEWWDWELELNPHWLKRMGDRRFTEIDLRRMLHRAAEQSR